MSLPEEHIKETEKLLRQIDRDAIAEWLLNTGYYPEQYVVPPCFRISNFKLKKNPIVPIPPKKKPIYTRYNLSTLSFPKTGLIQRVFGIFHPERYHDIVYFLHENWDYILDHLFSPENKINTYSIPIPVSSETPGQIGSLRSGRMIYEFLKMAEGDLVAEAYKYKILVRIDISNFYNSVYTHTIAWALHGREESLNDRKNELFGNKLDRLFQYSNDARTNGIPVGPAISDLITEIILANRDIKISNKLKRSKGVKVVNYLATRFKDDYRFLCLTEEDANRIIRTVIDTLNEFNLTVNERKTKQLSLPESLYRDHSLKYEVYSLKRFKKSKIPFKQFETTLLKTLEIHRDHPGTSLLDKFLSELTHADKGIPIAERLKLAFVSKNIHKECQNKVTKKNVRKLVSLLLFVKKESPKTLARVLSTFECLLHMKLPWFRLYITAVLKNEIKETLKTNSAFELAWLIYFVKRHNLKIDFDKVLKSKQNAKNAELLANPFIATLLGDRKNPFDNTKHKIDMYVEPKKCSHIYLVDYLDIFDKGEPES